MYTIFKSLIIFIKSDSKDFYYVTKYFYFKSNNINNVSWAANQHIMISEGSCDTE